MRRDGLVQCVVVRHETGLHSSQPRGIPFQNTRLGPSGLHGVADGTTAGTRLPVNRCGDARRPSSTEQPKTVSDMLTSCDDVIAPMSSSRALSWMPTVSERGTNNHPARPGHRPVRPGPSASARSSNPCLATAQPVSTTTEA